jgi:phage terminase large subunit
LSKLTLQIPAKLFPLTKPARFKGAHGGRGGAKSHFFAELSVEKAVAIGGRGVCLREIQDSIKHSVKSLIEQKIQKLGAGDQCEVLEQEIRTKRGGLLIFKGMQSYNAENIKSLDDFDFAWWEEAQTASQRSLDMLIPTIRKDASALWPAGSELWFSWNPRFDTDAIDSLLRGAFKPKGAIVANVNWQDNPWFPKVLHDEMLRAYAADPEKAEHVWGGGYEIVSEGAYYARWLAQADKEGRIGHYPYDGRQRLRTSWDIGIEDFMTCWFIMDDGKVPTVVDYYEANGVGFDEFIGNALPEVFVPPAVDRKFKDWSAQKALANLNRDVPFKYAKHFFPHDVAVRKVGAGGLHRYQTLHLLGMQNMMKGVPADPEERVGAVRALLPSMRFNGSNPRVMHGLKRLRRYTRKRNERMGNFLLGPEHDEASHGADSLGEYAINCELLPTVKAKAAPILPTEEEVDIVNGRIRSNLSVRQLIEMQERMKRMALD